jgi:predicted transcriptional regulator
VTDPAEVLFDTYIIDILTMVSENPMIKKSLIYERLGTKSSKPAILINRMVECGILDETPGERSIKHISITAEGERYLRMIQAMIEGKSMESTNHGAHAAVRDSVKG